MKENKTSIELLGEKERGSIPFSLCRRLNVAKLRELSRYSLLSRTCIGVHGPMREYPSKDNTEYVCYLFDLEGFAEYKCKKCGEWHLKPVPRPRRSKPQYCIECKEYVFSDINDVLRELDIMCFRYCLLTEVKQYINRPANLYGWCILNWKFESSVISTPKTIPSCDAECYGSDGETKKAYETKEDAERMAEILLDKEGVALRAYLCERSSSEFYHLTKG